MVVKYAICLSSARHLCHFTYFFNYMCIIVIKVVGRPHTSSFFFFVGKSGKKETTTAPVNSHHPLPQYLAAFIISRRPSPSVPLFKLNPPHLIKIRTTNPTKSSKSSHKFYQFKFNCSNVIPQLIIVWLQWKFAVGGGARLLQHIYPNFFVFLNKP